jgi:hypothetical protein
MAETPDGFILAGAVQPTGYYGTSAALLVKVDSNGLVQWNKNFPTAGNSRFESVFPTSDGGWIATGGIFTQANHPIVVKFSAGGDVLWSKYFESLSWSF